jgi:hypothetical protein
VLSKMKIQILTAIVAISATGAAATVLDCGAVQTLYQDAECCGDASSQDTCARSLSVTSGSGLTLSGTGELSLVHPQGPAGPTGGQGIQGPPGGQGIQGIQGIQGPPGGQGVKGATGGQGPSGITGQQGLDIASNKQKTTMISYNPTEILYEYQINNPLRLNNGLRIGGSIGLSFTDLSASRYLRVDDLFEVPGSSSSYVVSYGTGMDRATSLKATDGIMGANFFTHSDLRIKKDVTDADTSALLDKLNQLRMRNYGYIAKEGSTVGWIAQEVATVDAAYVSKQTEFVPDIDAVVAATVEDGKTTVNLSDFDIEVGQVLRVELRSGSKVVTVTGVADGMVTFDYAVVDEDVKYLQTEAGEVGTDGLIHIYGRQVDDFHTLDKNRILATAVGAIQELSTRVAATQALDAKIAALEVRLAALE